MKRVKGIVLYSGGLDSLLAARVLMEQDLDITGFHCILPFFPPDINPEDLKAARIAKQIGLNLVFYRCGRDYLKVISNPGRGYGKHMNPCIDCKIFFISKAALYMKEVNADFVATGEVVGQRPMSQMKHTMNHIEKETGLRRRLLRPLSAKLLKATIAEEEGLVIRDKLYNINGRSRKQQLELAKKFNIKEYQSPSGGCLFADSFISNRVRDLFDNHNDFDTEDIYLLTIGRHFRLSDRAKIIVSRNETENKELEKYRGLSDYFFLPEFKGPAAFVKGILTDDEIGITGSMIARYGKPEKIPSIISVFKKTDVLKKINIKDQIDDDELDKMRI